MVAPTSGLFNLRIGIDDVVSIWLRNKRVVNRNSPSSFDFQMQQNEVVPIRIEYDDSGRGKHAFWLEWRPPGQNWRRVESSQFRTDVVNKTLAFDSVTTKNGREFLINRLGLREATAAEILRAKEAGTPGVINQWTPKLQVGPGERPVAVNAYGFDTGGSGYWVVPLDQSSP